MSQGNRGRQRPDRQRSLGTVSAMLLTMVNVVVDVVLVMCLYIRIGKV